MPTFEQLKLIIESPPFCQDLHHWKEHEKIVRYVKFERSMSSLSGVMIFETFYFIASLISLGQKLMSEAIK
jgi:hypothetical protein